MMLTISRGKIPLEPRYYFFSKEIGVRRYEITSFESVGSAFKDLVKAHSTYLKSKRK